MKLVDKIQSPGIYEIQLDAGKLAPGTYLYQLKTDGHSEIKKFTITKSSVN
jgi:hypothetical protein